MNKTTKIIAACIMLGLLFSLKGNTQDVVFENSLDLSSGTVKALPVARPGDGLVFLLTDASRMEVWQLGPELNLQNSFTTYGPPKRFPVLLGSTFAGETGNLYYTSKQRNRFYVQTVDLSAKDSEDHFPEIELRKEKLLQTLSYKDRFYLFTIDRVRSNLLMYVLEGPDLVTREQYDLSGTPIDLYGMLMAEANAFDENLGLTKIHRKITTPLKLATDEAKMYHYDSAVYITLDDYAAQTDIISINLETYQLEMRNVNRDWKYCPARKKFAGNSYLTPGALYQVEGCKEGFTLYKKELSTGELQDSYHFPADELAGYGTNPIVQIGDGSEYVSNKRTELYDGIKSTRMINKGRVGLVVYESGSDRELSVRIGGLSRNRQGNAIEQQQPVAYGEIKSTRGKLTDEDVMYYNPLYYAFSRPAKERLVYFRATLDGENFKPLEQEANRHAFDKIRSFQRERKQKILAESVVRYKDGLLLGSYNKKDRVYRLRFFAD